MTSRKGGLQKFEVDGTWWARDPEGRWFEWDNVSSSWAPRPSAPRSFEEEPPAPAGSGPTATDPAPTPPESPGDAGPTGFSLDLSFGRRNEGDEALPGFRFSFRRHTGEEADALGADLEERELVMQEAVEEGRPQDDPAQPGSIATAIVPETRRVAPARHWGADPRARRAFMVLGPLVILLAGLNLVRRGDVDLVQFLIAFPVIAAGAVTASLIWGREAAQAYETGRRPMVSSGKAAIAFGAAVLALPVAVTVTSGAPLWIMLFSLLAVGIGVAMGIGIFHVPARMSPLWFLVPFSVVGGAGVTGTFAVASAAFSLWGSNMMTHSQAIAIWLVSALLLFGLFGAVAGTLSKNRMTRDEWISGVGLTMGLSLVAFFTVILVIEAIYYG